MKNYTGLEYLKIDVASHFGLDKLDFELRIKWVDNNDADLEKQVQHADDKFRYAAAVIAYRETQRKEPTGHMCGMDACASGMQVMSAISHCHVGAANTGLTGQHRQDVYSTVTAEMNRLLGQSTTWPRDIVKPAAMTFFYGSRQKPIDAFGEGTPELGAFYEAIKTIAPGAYKLMDVLINTWDPCATEHSWIMPDNFYVRNKVTVMTDTKIEVDELDHMTFLYRHEMVDCYEEGLANAANIVHSIDGFINRELCRRCNYNREELIRARLYLKHAIKYNRSEGKVHVRIEELYEQHGFVSLVGVLEMQRRTMIYFTVDYCKALLELVEDTLANEPVQVISVHDEFKAHANNMNRIRQVYIEIFAELAESTILNAILTDLTGKKCDTYRPNYLLGADIRKGNYALA